jgi:hypothetical protein
MSYNKETIKQAILKYSNQEYLGTNAKHNFETYLWHEKNKGRIYELNLNNDDITFIENNFNVKLNDYRDYEINVNEVIKKYINDFNIDSNIEINNLISLKTYIESRVNDKNFLSTINTNIVNQYNNLLTNKYNTQLLIIF